MKSKSRGPGRPRKPDAPDAAARMRASRERKRRAGFHLQQSWVAPTSAVYSDHQRLDARSLALHCCIARKLLLDPSLVVQVKNTLERWREQTAPPVPKYFSEWAQILKKPVPEIAAFLASMSETAVRLRQSSPFTGVLTADEREKIFEAFR
jgi:hypothetical protein